VKGRRYFCSREHRYEWQRHKQSNVTKCDHCGQPIQRNPEEIARSLRHFCNEQHYHEWRQGRRTAKTSRTVGMAQRRRRRASGRRKLKVLSLAEQASDSRLAAELGMHPDTVQKIRSKKGRGRPLTRYKLELARVVPREARSPLKETVFAWCHKNGVKTLLELANRMNVGLTTLHAALERGSATRPTLEKLAAVMGCHPNELAALSDPHPHRTPRNVANILFNVAVREDKEPDVDAIVARVMVDFADARQEDVRHYLESRQRKRRGQGPPRRYTREQELQVLQWRRQSPPLPWAEIGRRMGWPIKKRDCPRAHRAYERALSQSRR
jgi:AraC-like DNA-binding protein